MLNKFANFLKESYTAYNAVKNASDFLTSKGFVRLNEGEKWSIAPNGAYFVVRDGSSLIAFKTGATIGDTFSVVACHTDSPCLRLKNNCVVYGDGYAKLNVEAYGGGLYYSMLDRRLKIAGRVIVKENNALKAIPVVGDFFVTIPSLAIHQNREANSHLSLNPQIDMMPVVGLGDKSNPVDIVKAVAKRDDVVDFDLYVVPAEEPYFYGANREFFASARLDDLTGVFGGLCALVESKPQSIAVCACLDNEEVGSGTKQGAGGTFLKDVLHSIFFCLGRDKIDYKKAVANGFLVSMDNAHAVHPMHGEKFDATNRCMVNKGIVVKHNANQSYMTDGMSSAVFKQIMDRIGVPYQDFYNRSDERGGGTLGAISTRQVSMRTVDIGLAQLAMHSFCESMGALDLEYLVKGLTAVFGTKMQCPSFDKVVFD